MLKTGILDEIGSNERVISRQRTDPREIAQSWNTEHFPLEGSTETIAERHTNDTRKSGKQSTQQHRYSTWWAGETRKLPPTSRDIIMQYQSLSALSIFQPLPVSKTIPQNYPTQNRQSSNNEFRPICATRAHLILLGCQTQTKAKQIDELSTIRMHGQGILLRNDG